MTSRNAKGRSGKKHETAPVEDREKRQLVEDGEGPSPVAGEHPEAAAPESASAEPADLEARVAELEEELARKEEEVKEAADRALRTLAEFDNYRRRTDRERVEDAARGASQVVMELLEVADNFDRALEHAGDDVPESFLEGMRLVAQGLHDVLDRHGVSRIEAVGTAFDPEIHEALTSQPSDESEPNTVLQEIQPGYMMGDRVLRPAKVIVAAAVAGKEDS